MVLILLTVIMNCKENFQISAIIEKLIVEICHMSIQMWHIAPYHPNIAHLQRIMTNIGQC